MAFDVPVVILQGPPEIANWRETARITSVEFRRDNFLVRHTKEGTQRGVSWPGVHIPGWGNGADDSGEIQWTLWIVMNVNGRWVTAGCIEYWAEETPSLGVNRGGAAPFSDGAHNWWYQVPGMAGIQPEAGDRIGVMAVAGDQRMKDVRSVEERTPIAWVTVPLDDSGVFAFPEEGQNPPLIPEDAPGTPIPPVNPPVPASVDPRLLAQLEAVSAGLAMACQGLLQITKAIQAAIGR